MVEIQHIRFIIETGFRGVFVVREGRGASVPQDMSGTWIYKIPATGSLQTDTIKPFRELHDTQAIYTDGTPLGFAAIGPIKPFKDQLIKVRPTHRIPKAGFITWLVPRRSKTAL